MSAEAVDIDARLGWALGVSFSGEAPAAHAERVALVDRVNALGALADSGGLMTTTRDAIARGVASVAGVRVPTRPETVAVLSALALKLQESGIMDGRYAIELLDGFCVPWAGDGQMIDHVIAAADVGMFEPPGTIDPDELKPLPPDGHSCVDEAGTVILHLSRNSESAFVRARRRRTKWPEVTKPRSINEQFCCDWDDLLGGILEALSDKLYHAGHLEQGPTRL